MPDRDNWTAAMVLKWVLTRDQAAVPAMIDTYGATGLFEARGHRRCDDRVLH